MKALNKDFENPEKKLPELYSKEFKNMLDSMTTDEYFKFITELSVSELLEEDNTTEAKKRKGRLIINRPLQLIFLTAT